MRGDKTNNAQLTPSVRSLSFYKESLAGETDNYIHLRAYAERKSPAEVLRQLVMEVSDTVERITAITARDPDLAALWQRYLQVGTPCLVCFRLPSTTRV